MGERVMNDLSEDILQLEDKINSRDDEREATNAFLAEMRNGNTVRKTKSDDKEFKHSRDVLTSKRKYLRQQGKGNRPNQADPITKEEIDMLYQKGLLGGGNAKSLSNTVFLNNSMYFGMRSRTEHEHLRWGDVELKTTSSSERYLEYSERATKTRTGVNSDSRAFPQRCLRIKEIKDVQSRCTCCMLKSDL
ncbi:unnamed protein product [Mytilus coruscus]|uniref:ZMYM2-like/QRICH1 C-terminal domain-containing protein n=1 Tax=Mytilus coruscus TaxID=42192 RepID=A0A6J8A2P0_MYTCO|nr:unnamed protein product [Mytilus coruscus]